MTEISWADIDGADDAVDAAVAGTTALRHAQSHAVLSSDHSDVTPSTPADGQALVYDQASGTFEAKPIIVQSSLCGVIDGGTC